MTRAEIYQRVLLDIDELKCDAGDIERAELRKAEGSVEKAISEMTAAETPACCEAPGLFESMEYGL